MATSRRRSFLWTRTAGNAGWARARAWTWDPVSPAWPIDGRRSALTVLRHLHAVSTAGHATVHDRLVVQPVRCDLRGRQVGKAAGGRAPGLVAGRAHSLRDQSPGLLISRLYAERNTWGWAEWRQLGEASIGHVSPSRSFGIGGFCAVHPMATLGGKAVVHSDG
jgi:hypothetical protein